MVRTYQGYFQEGRFISPKNFSIPEYVEVFVVVTDKSVSTQESEIFNADTFRKSNLILPPSLDTRGWKFDREEANAR